MALLTTNDMPVNDSFYERLRKELGNLFEGANLKARPLKQAATKLRVGGDHGHNARSQSIPNEQAEAPSQEQSGAATRAQTSSATHTNSREQAAPNTAPVRLTDHELKTLRQLANKGMKNNTAAQDANMKQSTKKVLAVGLGMKRTAAELEAKKISPAGDRLVGLITGESKLPDTPEAQQFYEKLRTRTQNMEKRDPTGAELAMAIINNRHEGLKAMMATTRGSVKNGLVSPRDFENSAKEMRDLIEKQLYAERTARKEQKIQARKQQPHSIDTLAMDELAKAADDNQLTTATAARSSHEEAAPEAPRQGTAIERAAQSAAAAMEGKSAAFNEAQTAFDKSYLHQRQPQAPAAFHEAFVDPNKAYGLVSALQQASDTELPHVVMYSLEQNQTQLSQQDRLEMAKNVVRVSWHRGRLENNPAAGRADAIRTLIGNRSVEALAVKDSAEAEKALGTIVATIGRGRSLNENTLAKTELRQDIAAYTAEQQAKGVDGKLLKDNQRDYVLGQAFNNPTAARAAIRHVIGARNGAELGHRVAQLYKADGDTAFLDTLKTEHDCMLAEQGSAAAAQAAVRFVLQEAKLGRIAGLDLQRDATGQPTARAEAALETIQKTFRLRQQARARVPAQPGHGPDKGPGGGIPDNHSLSVEVASGVPAVAAGAARASDGPTKAEMAAAYPRAEQTIETLNQEADSAAHRARVAFALSEKAKHDLGCAYPDGRGAVHGLMVQGDVPTLQNTPSPDGSGYAVTAQREHEHNPLFTSFADPDKARQIYQALEQADSHLIGEAVLQHVPASGADVAVSEETKRLHIQQTVHDAYDNELSRTLSRKAALEKVFCGLSQNAAAGKVDLPALQVAEGKAAPRYQPAPEATAEMRELDREMNREYPHAAFPNTLRVGDMVRDGLMTPDCELTEVYGATCDSLLAEQEEQQELPVLTEVMIPGDPPALPDGAQQTDIRKFLRQREEDMPVLTDVVIPGDPGKLVPAKTGGGTGGGSDVPHSNDEMQLLEELEDDIRLAARTR